MQVYIKRMYITHIAALGYTTLDDDLEGVSAAEAAIQLCRHDKYRVWVLKCKCGITSHITENSYDAGLTVNGGMDPVKGNVGILFEPYNIRIKLRCGGCGAAQCYERNDEFERSRRSPLRRLFRFLH